VKQKGSLTFDFLSSSQLLWLNVNQIFQKKSINREIVFPSSLSKDLFIENRLSAFPAQAIEGRNLLTIDQLVNKYFKQVVKEKYQVVDLFQEKAVLLQIIEKYSNQLPQLNKLIQQNHFYLDDLLLFLDRIERQLDIQYQDYINSNQASVYEQELQLLRKSLEQEKILFRSARYSLFARHLKDVQLNKQFVFTPLATWNFQLGGLLKGLSVNHSVKVLFIADLAGSVNILQQLGFQEKDLNNVQVNYPSPDKIIKRSLSAPEQDKQSLDEQSLNSLIKQPEKASDGPSATRLTTCSRILPAAASIVNNWLKEGVPATDILIIDNDVDYIFFELSAIIKHSLRGRKKIKFPENKAAVLIKEILDNQENIQPLNSLLNEDDITPDQFKHDDNYLRVDQNDLQQLQALFSDKKNNDPVILQIIYQLLSDSVAEEDDLNSFLWLDHFKQLLTDNDQQQTVDDYSLLLQSLTSNSLLYGQENDLLLTSYGEASSFTASHICCLLRSDSSKANLKFASDNLLKNYPLLTVQNPLFPLEVLLNSDYQQLNFVIEDQDIVNNAFVNKRSENLQINHFSEERELLSDDQITEASQLINELEDLTIELPSKLTVTEYQKILECQLGWMISKQLKNISSKHPSENRASSQGDNIHKILEQLKYKQYSKLISDIKDNHLPETKALQSLMNPVEYKLLITYLIRTVEHIAPVYQQANSILVEQQLTGFFTINDQTIELTGTVDAILEFPDGFVLIDYKKNKPPEAQVSAQAIFYPLLLSCQQEFTITIPQKPVLAFIYLGIESQSSTIFYNKNLQEEYLSNTILEDFKNNFKTKSVSSKNWPLNSGQTAKLPEHKDLDMLQKKIQELVDTDLKNPKTCSSNYCLHNLVNTTFRMENEDL
jgi:hypothetical protein